MALKAGRRGPRLEAGWLRGDYGLTAADPARPSGGRPRSAPALLGQRVRVLRRHDHQRRLVQS